MFDKDNFSEQIFLLESKIEIIDQIFSRLILYDQVSDTGLYCKLQYNRYPKLMNTSAIS